MCWDVLCDSCHARNGLPESRKTKVSTFLSSLFHRRTAAESEETVRSRNVQYSSFTYAGEKEKQMGTHFLSYTSFLVSFVVRPLLGKKLNTESSSCSLRETANSIA